MMVLEFGKPDYKKFSNKINRLQYSIYWIPFITTIKYFKNYENVYFLFLAVFQLLTLGIFPKEWSPTGPFSTAIPLAICVIIEIITEIIRWYTIWKQDEKENHKIFQSVNINHTDKFRGWTSIKNQDLYPGYIIYLSKNDICPIDGVLIGTITDDYAKINLALLTGESNIQHISKPNRNLLLDDYIGSELILHSNSNGYIKVNKNTENISECNFIPAGSIIKSDGIYIWIVACGKDKTNKVNKIIEKKYSRIDKFVSEYIMQISVFLLIILVIIISIVKTLYSTDPNILTFVLFCIQNWILFNSIIPFSVKIFLILARNLEAYYGQTRNINTNEPLLIDNIGGIQKIVCDKTGTITKNELEFTKLIVTGSNKIIDIDSYSTETQLIPKEFYECLGLCIHQNENDFATIEDKIIKTGFLQISENPNSYKLSDNTNVLVYGNQMNIYHYINVND